MIRSSLALAFALVGVLPVFGGDQPTIITGSDEFEFVYRVKLPSIDGKARLWMPLARTDAFQTVRVDEISIPIKWEKVQDRDYGNDICVLNPARGGQRQNHRVALPRTAKREERLPCE